MAFEIKKLEELQHYNNGFFASNSLREELFNKKLPMDTPVINFAYTDYGGNFFDKVAVKYFTENHPENIVSENTSWNGENALVFGDIAKEFIEVTESYLLGFGDMEELFYKMESDEENEAFGMFLDDMEDKYSFDREDALKWLNENRGGYYSVRTSGLDYSETELVSTLEGAGIFTPPTDDEDEEVEVIKPIEVDENQLNLFEDSFDNSTEIA